MNACATALPETVSTRTVPAAADAPADAGRPRPPPGGIDIRRQAARVVATTRRHWFDAERRALTDGAVAPAPPTPP